MDTSPTTQDPPIKPRRVRLRRLVALVVVGGLLIGGTLVYRHYWYARPIGTGPAGAVVGREAFQSVWSRRKVLLVGIGDSVTAGFGATARHGYFDRLVANTADEFVEMEGICLSRVLPNLEVNNVALSGSTSIECVDLLIPKLQRQDEETFGIVVMTTGGNDIIHMYGRTPPREGAMYGATIEQAQPWIANFAARLDLILDRIEATFPGGCEFFVANIYDPTDGIGDAFHAGLPAWPDALQVLAAYNEIITRAAEKRKNVHMIDMRSEFLGHGIHCVQFWRDTYRSNDPHYWYADNLEDPNDRGYDALRRLFLIEMSRVLPSVLSQLDAKSP